MSTRTRVLVVDDSAFARKVLRRVLASSPDLEVVDIARDGLEAIEKIAELRPDVVTLDLMMPHLDGVGVMRALPAEAPPRVVLVSTSDARTRVAAEALALGAVELVHKPTALATDRLYELGDQLVAAVRRAALARPLAAAGPAPVAASFPPRAPTMALLAIGTSTGGPQALTRLLAALPADLPVPAVCALHIPSGYTAALADRLDRASPLHVVEAREGLPLTAGTVVLARGGIHLYVARGDDGPICHLDVEPVAAPHSPSVDVLFQSAAAAAGAVLGVVLTGMGRDGQEGARAVRAAGGRVLAEAESSCVVYGMPRAVFEAGLADDEAPLHRMAQAIIRCL